jgi:hypothetical protein
LSAYHLTLCQYDNKVRNLRKKIKGWHRNRESELRKEKVSLTSELNRLDLLAEQSMLFVGELDRIRVIKTQLEKLWLMDKIRARQRSRDRDIRRGQEQNLFFAKANQRRRKKIISGLENNGDLISGNEGMHKHAVNFYKTMFGEEAKDNISMDDDFWKYEEKVIEEENEMLNSQFSKEEIKMAIDNSFKNSGQS